MSDLAEKQRQTRDGVVDPTRIRKDLKVLHDVRWQTKAWKAVLGRVAQPLFRTRKGPAREPRS